MTWLILLVMGVAGCEEKSRIEIGEPFSKLEGINDSFTLIQVVQVDERSQSLSNTMDISHIFIKNDPPKITFNSNDKTFTLEPGDSPNYLINNGSWSFDDDDFPTALFLSGNGEMIDLDLERTIRTIDNTLEFKFTRTCSGSASVGYIYIFERN